MKIFYTLLLLLLISNIYAQNTEIKGQLQDADGVAIVFANVVLHSSADSSLVKVETTNESGIFQILNVTAGKYFLQASYVGFPDFLKKKINFTG